MSAGKDFHRIGGAAIENLRLKPRERRLGKPGISVLKADTPASHGFRDDDGALTMRKRTVKLSGRNGQSVAMAEVTPESDRYEGTADLRDTPQEVLSLFQEFEEIVNGQMFSFLDEIQGKIAALGTQAVFDDGERIDVRNLQVFPGTGGVSFEAVPVSGQTESVNGSVRG
ncbi:MAG: hypothetical protein U0793_15885 [Gemmataceae bacterium]